MGAIVRAAIWAAWRGFGKPAPRITDRWIDPHSSGSRLAFGTLGDLTGQTAAFGATEPALLYSHGASYVAVGW